MSKNSKAEQVRKKLERKEREILKATKVFLNSHSIEYNEIHETILKNAMREMIGCCRALIQPEFEKIDEIHKKNKTNNKEMMNKIIAPYQEMIGGCLYQLHIEALLTGRWDFIQKTQIPLRIWLN